MARQWARAGLNSRETEFSEEHRHVARGIHRSGLDGRAYRSELAASGLPRGGA